MSKVEISNCDQIDSELETVKSVDQQVEPKVADKLLDTVFSPRMSSESQVCIHQSRSITC